MTTMKTRCPRSGVCLGVVALLALTAATACTGRQEEAAPATTAATPPATEAPPSTEATAPDGRRAHPGHGSPLDALPEAVRSLVDKPFTGDFDEMVKRRTIRVAVTFNRTHYFIDRHRSAGSPTRR